MKYAAILFVIAGLCAWGLVSWLSGIPTEPFLAGKWACTGLYAGRSSPVQTLELAATGKGTVTYADGTSRALDLWHHDGGQLIFTFAGSGMREAEQVMVNRVTDDEVTLDKGDGRPAKLHRLTPRK